MWCDAMMFVCVVAYKLKARGIVRGKQIQEVKDNFVNVVFKTLWMEPIKKRMCTIWSATFGALAGAPSCQRSKIRSYY